MTVYVDNMRARYGRLVMCHMIADTEAELHVMAGRIGMKRRWYQGDHYDICLAKRDLAVRFGAVEVTMRQLGCMAMRRRATGQLGSPSDAVEWARNTCVGHQRNHGKTALAHLAEGHKRFVELYDEGKS
ncbi:MAG: DUF4031 domain-containing protein [Denitratisoma sp.]|nr:DUF4031 domain-containing protein [Denitratisoma sp.]